MNIKLLISFLLIALPNFVSCQSPMDRELDKLSIDFGKLDLNLETNIKYIFDIAEKIFNDTSTWQAPLFRTMCKYYEEIAARGASNFKAVANYRLGHLYLKCALFCAQKNSKDELEQTCNRAEQHLRLVLRQANPNYTVYKLADALLTDLYEISVWSKAQKAQKTDYNVKEMEQCYKIAETLYNNLETVSGNIEQFNTMKALYQRIECEGWPSLKAIAYQRLGRIYAFCSELCFKKNDKVETENFCNKAQEYYQSAVNQKDYESAKIEAQMGLCNLYACPIWSKKNSNSRHLILESIIDNPLSDSLNLRIRALFMLGYNYLYGDGTIPNNLKAKNMFEKILRDKKIEDKSNLKYKIDAYVFLAESILNCRVENYKHVDLDSVSICRRLVETIRQYKQTMSKFVHDKFIKIETYINQFDANIKAVAQELNRNSSRSLTLLRAREF